MTLTTTLLGRSISSTLANPFAETQVPMVTREQVDFALATDDGMVLRALTVLFERQTLDEKEVEETKWLNARGFNKWSARQGTYLARKVRYGEDLTQDEINWARGVALVHSRQIADEINRRMGN